MKGKKTSSEKIVAVVTAKIANPDLSSRDIEEQVWDVDHSTVSRILDNDLQQLATSSEKVNELFEYNMQIIKEWAKKLANSMGIFTPADIREAKDYQSILDVAFKQNQLLQWKATDNVKISVENMEQAKEALKTLLK